jgi:hypothetical protein
MWTVGCCGIGLQGLRVPPLNYAACLTQNAGGRFRSKYIIGEKGAGVNREWRRGGKSGRGVKREACGVTGKVKARAAGGGLLGGARVYWVFTSDADGGRGDSSKSGGDQTLAATGSFHAWSPLGAVVTKTQLKRTASVTTDDRSGNGSVLTGPNPRSPRR